MNYRVRFNKNTEKQYRKLTDKEKRKLKEMVDSILKLNPLLGKKLQGEMLGYYSLRLNLKDRLVYKISKEMYEVYIKSVTTHYGD